MTTSKKMEGDFKKKEKKKEDDLKKYKKKTTPQKNDLNKNGRQTN